MAYCTKCGSTVEDTAAFCPACGASTGASQPRVTATAPAGAKRSTAPLLIAIAVALFAVLAIGGFFLKGYLDDQALSKRARAQAEAVADFISGAYITFDARLVSRSISDDYADRAEEMVEGSSGDGPRVTRSWDGDTLVLDVKDEGSPYTISIASDGDDESAQVAIDVDASGDNQSIDAIVEAEGSRWIVVDFNGASVAEMFGDDPSSAGGTGGSDEAICQANQRLIEGAVQQYLAASDANGIGDLIGDVDQSSILVGEYILDIPRCPSDRSLTYYIFDDGTTECPSGVHDHY